MDRNEDSNMVDADSWLVRFSSAACFERLFRMRPKKTKNDEDGFALYGSAHFGSANQPWHGKETCNKTLTKEVPRREENATSGENGYLISRGFRAQNSGVSGGFQGFPRVSKLSELMRALQK